MGKIYPITTWFLLGFIIGGYQGYHLYPNVHPIPIPVPPGPGPVPPGPTPVPPVPPPNPPPIASDGYAVLILYESGDISKYPKEQSNILYDQSVRSLLDTLCYTDPKTKTKQYRIWDKDVVVVDTKMWQDVMSRPHPTMPWVVISNGKTGTECPLPKNSSEFKDLLNKYK